MRPAKSKVKRHMRKPYRMKPCKFCISKKDTVDYKNVDMLRGYITERGKILPRRISGNCSLHQRRLTKAIKRSRNAGLLPYTTLHVM